PEVVVDAIHLLLVEHVRDFEVERAGALKVAAKRLFDHHPAPGALLLPGINQIRVSQLVDDRREELRSDRQIKNTIAAGSVNPVDFLERLLEPMVRRGVVKRSGGEHEPVRELPPNLAKAGIAVRRHGLLVLGAELGVAPVAPSETHNGALCREIAPPRKLK